MDIKEFFNNLLGKDGVKVSVAPDPATTALAALFLFLAFAGALFLHKRVF